MADSAPSAAHRNDTQGLRLDVGAWTARQEARIRRFASSPYLEPPPVLFRFRPPVRRASRRREPRSRCGRPTPPVCSESGARNSTSILETPYRY
jgi:hypothetical protein